MTEAKHTPGPWSHVPQLDGSTLIAHKYATGKQMNPTGLRIVCFVLERASSLTEDEANVRLIAAAPDLLATLKDARHAIAKAPEDTWGFNAHGDGYVIGGMESWPIRDELLHYIDAAISKAEGRA